MRTSKVPFTHAPASEAKFQHIGNRQAQSIFRAKVWKESLAILSAVHVVHACEWPDLHAMAGPKACMAQNLVFMSQDSEATQADSPVVFSGLGLKCQGAVPSSLSDDEVLAACTMQRALNVYFGI